VIGEVEQEKWSAGNRQQLKSCAALRDCTTYLDLLDEIQTAGCFIGNDSGPAHLAGIIGLPTLALFGPTNPTQWRPLGPHVSVLQHATVDDVFNLITANSSFSGRPQGAPSLTPSTDDDE
jgi:ADP-heptose:LPS heptosyltransferase